MGIKRERREADHSLSSNAEDKKCGATPPCLHSIEPNYIIKYRDNVNFVYFISVLWKFYMKLTEFLS
jgi:hypothetical protein